ncbi:MAG TPA: iron-sulfur cluster assembly protein [Streptosporangiaceae bacterium]|nr:iron-sulfur cluster assembly protein [Streptosporangiaceae bacterium]
MNTPPKRYPLETTDLTPRPAPPSPPAAESAVAAPGADLTAAQVAELEQQIVAVLHTCFDPEIPVNIYELGLVYNIDIKPTGAVELKMTLTSPACPVAGSLPPEVQAKIQKVPGVTAARVDVVWEPPWDKDRMSEAAKLQLGIDDY